MTINNPPHSCQLYLGASRLLTILEISNFFATRPDSKIDTATKRSICNYIEAGQVIYQQEIVPLLHPIVDPSKRCHSNKEQAIQIWNVLRPCTNSFSLRKLGKPGAEHFA
jgi:hypothetical protein